MSKFLSKLKSTIKSVLDFQGRVWVVNVYSGPHKGESYIVNEDSFSEPMQWMKSKGYPAVMINQIDAMNPSQVREFDLGYCKHRLMRVK
ncbi:hypothetical protein RCJ22_34120 [Vibrio sp. FNV 38]|nr:hypothetical protein [Vibrio sp. FNV 38]